MHSKHACDIPWDPIIGLILHHCVRSRATLHTYTRLPGKDDVSELTSLTFDSAGDAYRGKNMFREWGVAGISRQSDIIPPLAS